MGGFGKLSAELHDILNMHVMNCMLIYLRSVICKVSTPVSQ